MRRKGAGTPLNIPTALCRLIAVALLGSLWMFQQEANDSLETLWRVLRANWVFQHESFEV